MSHNNITDDYFKIFGHKVMNTLYMSDDNEYIQFRQKIINSPIERYDKSRLPFDEGFLIRSFSLDNLKKRLMIGYIVYLLLNKDNDSFYIKKASSPLRFCDAIGSYNNETNAFIIKAGSILSLKSAVGFSLTPAAVQRDKFLKEECSLGLLGYRLMKDYKCGSPSEAAMLCLGRNANGWIEWKDKSGYSLRFKYKGD